MIRIFFFSHKDINTLSTTFNLEMTKLSDWCRANKLSLNLKKSNFMIFQPRQKYHLAFSIDGSQIEQVKETVFLGVVIAENLTWKPHILNVLRKISKSIGVSCTGQVFAFLQPLFVFCIIA